MSVSSVHADAPPEVVVDPEGLQFETGPQLGKGGFAICHRAKLLGHEHLSNNVVALKIVKSKMEPPKLAQKFVTELQIHSKLSHPSIVEFYRAFSFDKSTFVVLELCSNGSLADAIKKRRYFTMPEIRRFMIQTCGAVKYLHQRNIVHRDLKTGNLFLDQNMNVKVGDFGLAALLLSQDDLGAIRRTTMCGTPNYLAPEVLEKTGKGHDEKVDLWAIGIMMYTLAVGRAPFHAAKREDIYKKLRAREYTWPDLSKFANEITDDLRDIVAMLLVVEDERPTPDEIVNHPFFKLGYIPLTLDDSCTSRVPKWPKITPPTAATIRRGYTEEWYTFCKASSVGEYETGKTFGAYGSRRNKTVARDCQKEIESGKQPNIPFAHDTVYLPFPARTHWPFQAAGGLSEIPEEKESSSEGQALVETSGNDRVKGRLPRITKREQPMRALKENDEPTKTSTMVRRPAEKQPVRMRAVRKISNPGRVTAASAAPAPIRVPRDTRTLQRTRSVKEAVKIMEQALPEVQPVKVKKPTPTVVDSNPVAATQTGTKRIGPTLRSVGAELPASDPSSVLAKLETFRNNVARALQRKPSTSRREDPPRLPFVSKWVDYSRKHGIGFMLEDGTTGCLVKSTSRHPVITGAIRAGYAHLAKVDKEPAYLDRMPINYYAAPTIKAGMSRVEIIDQARQDQVLLIWRKFSKYMCHQLGAEEKSVKNQSRENHFVKFYQRLGGVGFWGFEDGSFQVNFPDHTKIVFSADAGHCRFLCLPLSGLVQLKEKSDVSWKAIKERESLQGSIQQLLYGSANKQDDYRKLTEGNDFRPKLEFVESVFAGWVEGGGLGCLRDPKSYSWDGPQLEDSKRQDWVSVGRFGGDQEVM